MNSLQDHAFFLVAAYGVSALLVAAELALLWRRRRARAHCGLDAHSAGEDRP
ncbi:MAG: heme exporter protein CcmD [Comamonadaceae bacterium]|nr:MAG: heme exporter protein CcmD [Comamonadaceae bacterium]